MYFNLIHSAGLLHESVFLFVIRQAKSSLVMTSPYMTVEFV